MEEQKLANQAEKYRCLSSAPFQDPGQPCLLLKGGIGVWLTFKNADSGTGAIAHPGFPSHHPHGDSAV